MLHVRARLLHPPRLLITAVFSLALSGCVSTGAPQVESEPEATQSGPRVTAPARIAFTDASSKEDAPEPSPEAASISDVGNNERMPGIEKGAPTPNQRARDVGAEPANPKGPWHQTDPRIARDIAAGKPLTIQVFIPLCSNDQIDCGSTIAGKAGRAKTNLYWGAIFGARRIFERARSGWERIELVAGGPKQLERAVYRRWVPGVRWGLAKDKKVEQIVVLQAIHGDQINHAVKQLWSTATTGGKVTVVKDKKSVSLDVHVVGYAGHNRLMDGVKLPSAPAKKDRAPRPSFVLACYSESYFAPKLKKAGSRPLVTTRALMAPEGYLVDSLAQGLGENLSEHELNERVVRTYAKWQRISVGTARRIFEPR